MMKDPFDSTNWIGYGAAIVLIAVSFAAAFFVKTPAPQPRAVQLPPIATADIQPGFVGKQAFGLWTLICEDLAAPATAPVEGETAPTRLCRTNAQMTVRGPNNAMLLAAGFNVVMMDTKPVAAIVFRLPPSARAANSANFAIDDNTMFEAPLRCGEKECLVQGALPADALEQMRTGRTLSLVYTVKDRQQQDKKVRVDQLLHGFRQSYDAMTRAIS
jgi:invasion protein IalB